MYCGSSRAKSKKRGEGAGIPSEWTGMFGKSTPFSTPNLLPTAAHWVQKPEI
jgi:hypothetical protein